MTEGIRPEQISTIYNFVDLDRFVPRQPLPPKPRSVLVFSNYASDIHDAIRDECRSFGIERLDVAGLASGKPTAKPEQILPQYDIVFAKGRAAIEALATGCAVVVADYSRTAGIVTSANFAEFRRFNFGVRTLQKPLSGEAVQQAFASYDPADAQKVASTIRSTASLTGAVDQYLSVYDEVMRGWRDCLDHSSPKDTLAAASRYLRWLSPVIKDRDSAGDRAEKLGSELASVRSEKLQAELTARQSIEKLGSELASVQSEKLQAELTARQSIEKLGSELASGLSDAEALREHVVLREKELASIRASRAWRAVQAYGRIKHKVWKP